MASNFYDSNKQNHGVLGYEVSATQHAAPFVNGWFIRAYSNVYTMDETRLSIRHYHGVQNRARWTCIFKYRTDNYYKIEVYDSVEIDGEFYNRMIYTDIAYNLRDAVHFANIHKSDN